MTPAERWIAATRDRMRSSAHLGGLTILRFAAAARARCEAFGPRAAEAGVGGVRRMTEFGRSLSGRLLVLTVIFVMIAEILIFLPSVAYFRRDYLVERLEAAQLASLALRASGEAPIAPPLEAELLRRADVFSVAVRREDRRELLMSATMSAPVEGRFDLRHDGFFTLIFDALACAFISEPRMIAVRGWPTQDMAPMGADPDGYVEIVVDEGELKSAMLAFAVRIFWLSLAISAITALLMFLTVRSALVRPMRGVIDGIVSFRENPEDSGRIIQASGVGGEIGLAERELAETQREVLAALKQKSRLAALGEAVAKINHDLRNILASAQLLTDRLESSKDPMVARVAPKLVASLDRAIRLCKHTLAYGRTEESPPEIAAVDLRDLVEEIGFALGLGVAARTADGPTEGCAQVRFENRVAPEFVIWADSDQIHRALLNLSRNAAQAIEAAGRDGLVAIEAREVDGGGVEIDVVDDGPGLPEAAKSHLFEPFRGSVRKGGSGLGLAIAAELARGHGGSASLVSSDENGARFRIALPRGRVEAAA